MKETYMIIKLKCITCNTFLVDLRDVSFIVLWNRYAIMQVYSLLHGSIKRTDKEPDHMENDLI